MNDLRLEHPGTAGADPDPCPGTETGAGVVIAHEIPGRLRAKLALLRRPRLDTDHLSRMLRATPGVTSVRINAHARSVIVKHDGTSAARSRILGRLSALQRDHLRFRRPGDHNGPSPLPLAGRAALIAAMPFLPAPLSMVLGTATLSPRILRGLRSLVTDGVTVELLDALAVSIGALRGQFRTALTTDLMMGSGEFLEETTIRHSDDRLEDLLMPHPETAWVERDGQVVEVPFATVKEGDIVIVNTGELVPVDGVVRGGAAQVNQASITGESVPVGKSPNDSIIAGSYVESGYVKIEAQQVGDQTTTARIAALIRESLSEHSNAERLAHKHADKQVYMTLGLGLGTLVLTRDLRRVSSVLLVDYACPIKLSAPVAVRATMSEAASRGILIKGGPTIEKLAEIDTFVFDKTGTLTHGSLSVTDVVPLAPRTWSDERLLALAASVEEHSQHPVARAIVGEARTRGTGHIPHGDITFDVGRGLRATVDGEEVLIGSRHFLEDLEGVDFSGHAEPVDRLVTKGEMLLYVAVGRKPIGLVGLRDELRTDARETADRLRASGAKSLVMLTGDRRVRSEAFGTTLGFDKVHAELRPEDKVRILKELEQTGRKIAFIGDGVNDAPALAAASVGFSMSQSADIAQAAADITLLDDRISAIADAHEMSAQAMRIIGNNTTAAIGINTGLFIAASAGVLSPVAAAVLHNGSTIGLLVSALSRAGLTKRSSAASPDAPPAN